MKSMEEIREALGAHRPEVVAAETGLSYATVMRYQRGAVTNPPLETVQKLSDWLSGQEEPAEVQP